MHDVASPPSTEAIATAIPAIAPVDKELPEPGEGEVGPVGAGGPNAAVANEASDWDAFAKTSSQVSCVALYQSMLPPSIYLSYQDEAKPCPAKLLTELGLDKHRASNASWFAASD